MYQFIGLCAARCLWRYATIHCGIERISSEIKAMNIKGVLNLFENLKEEEV